MYYTGRYLCTNVNRLVLRKCVRHALNLLGSSGISMVLRSEANLRRFGNYDWTQTKWVVARYVALRDPDSYPDNLAGQLESVLGGRIWDLQVPITCCWDRMDDRHTVVNPDTSWNDIIHLEDS